MVLNVTEDSLLTSVEETISELESIQLKNQADHQRCSYHFGYLADLHDRSLIPEECLLCSKVIKCVLYLEKIF